MTEFISERISRKEIRQIAKNIRERFGLSEKEYFPTIAFFERFSTIFEKCAYDFEIVEDSELDTQVQGDFDYFNNCIRIKESVYNGACNGNGKDRFSIVHEIAHFFLLKIFRLKFERNFSRREIKPYEDLEWQADVLAAELLMPYDLVKGWYPCMIEERCKVSYTAANRQYNIIHRR